MKKETIHDLLPKIDEFHQALTPEVRQYLNGRGINDEVISHRKIGLGKHCGKLWITIPVTNAKGEPVQMILRKPPNAPDEQMRYKIPKDGSSVLFGADSLASDPDTILCCEGVLDACAAESLGLCAISGTTGVNTFPDVWFDHIPKAPKTRRFIVCFDADKAGKNGAQKFLLKASELRPDLELFAIELPEMATGKDLTDFLLQCIATDKKEALLALAMPYTPPTPRDQLLTSLSDETSFAFLAPSQGYINGKGFLTVTLRHEKKLSPFTITSERECFPCDPEEWQKHGCQIDREPVIDAIPRWGQSQMLAFLKKEDGETLSLADAIIYVRDHLQKYLDFSDPRCFSVIATWIVMTYCYRFFPAIPYLHLTGLKGAGKTKVMQIIALLSFNGELVTSSSSAASITRLVHGNGATLCVDEAESLGNSQDENSGTLQDVLRSGYKQGIFVTKCEKDAEGRQTVIRLDPFSPKALSGIRGLEDALSTRCIEVLMLRTTNLALANSEIVPFSSEWQDVRAIVYPAVLLTMPMIKNRTGTFTLTQFAGRNAELWRPLLLLVDVAGLREVHDDILSYAITQVDQKKDDEKDADIGKLLSCLGDLLGTPEKGFIAADEIFQALGQEDEFSWLLEQKNRSKRGKWLNTRLKRLAIWKGAARLRSEGGKKEKGYDIERSKLTKATVRLGLTLSPESVTPDTASSIASQ